MQLKLFFFVFFIVFLSFPLWAGKEIVFRNQTQVYAQRDKNAEVIGVYERGDSIPISNIKYGQWRKVIAEVDGKRRVGWIFIKDVKGSKVKESREIESARDRAEGNAPVYHLKNGVGILGAISYAYQGSGSLKFHTDTPGLDLDSNFSAVKGANFYFGFFGDYSLSKTTILRGYLLQRKMNRAGTGQVNVSGAPNSSFRIEQDLLSLGAQLKFYSGPKAIFWWGPGVEIGKTTKMRVDVTTAIDEMHVDTVEKPMFVILTAAAGYDYHISGNFFILPEFRLGIVPNGKPFGAVFEILIPVSYQF